VSKKPHAKGTSLQRATGSVLGVLSPSAVPILSLRQVCPVSRFADFHAGALLPLMFVDPAYFALGSYIDFALFGFSSEIF